MATSKRSLLIILTICIVGTIAWLGISARKSSVVYSFGQLQKAETSDHAKDHLMNLAETSPDARRYLVARLSQLIADEKLLHSNNSVWINAVHLAGDLHVDEAAPSLARWIDVEWGGPTDMSRYAAMEDNPPGQALAKIGDHAIPALKDVLDRGSARERTNAVRALFLIGSEEAKRALMEHLKDESDPQLRKTMEGIVRESR
jgi:HEAT repeat protein